MSLEMQTNKILQNDKVLLSNVTFICRGKLYANYGLKLCQVSSLCNNFNVLLLEGVLSKVMSSAERLVLNPKVDTPLIAATDAL